MMSEIIAVLLDNTSSKATEKQITKKFRKKVISSGGYIGVHDDVNSVNVLFKANRLKSVKKVFKYVIWELEEGGKWSVVDNRWNFCVSFPAYRHYGRKRLTLKIIHHYLVFDPKTRELIFKKAWHYHPPEQEDLANKTFDSFEQWKEYVIKREKENIENCRAFVETKVSYDKKHKYLRFLPTYPRFIPYRFGLSTSVVAKNSDESSSNTSDESSSDGHRTESDSGGSQNERAFKKSTELQHRDSDSDIGILLDSNSSSSEKSDNKNDSDSSSEAKG
jgi:hypothetical protein